MISRSHRALFVHIPKCAGQSVENFFLERSGLSWRERDELCMGPNADPGRGPPRLAHMTANEYLKLGYVSSEEFRSFYKFSFVRNPWDRLVSEYRYRSYDKLYDFRTFVLGKLPGKGWSDAYRHVMPQVEYLLDESGRLLVDFVGRFETLQDDFSRVADHLGFDAAVLPKVNDSKSDRHNLVSRSSVYRVLGFCRGRLSIPEYAHYRDYYDDETREFVSELYRDDISTFKYEF